MNLWICLRRHVLVEVGQGKSDDRCMNVEKKTWIGAHTKVFQGHLFELAVDCLDSMTMGAEIKLIPPVECLHVRPHLCNKTDVRISQNGSYLRCTDIGLFTQQRSDCRQSVSQLMHGRRLMQRSWQKREVYRLTSQRTDQMRTPTKELLIFGGTINAPTHFVATPGLHAPTDRYRHRINHIRFSRCEEFTQRFDHQQQPVTQSMQMPIEAGDAPLA